MSEQGETEEYRYVTQSELKRFRQCPLAWKLAYVDKLASPPGGSALLRRDRGTNWHLMLEHRYRAMMEDGLGPSDEETTQRVMQALNDAFDRFEGSAYTSEEFALLKWMYEGYCERWDKVDEDLTVVAVEEIFEVPMPVEGAPNLVITGKIDLITEHNDPVTGEVFQRVWDHKSASGRDVSKDAFVTEMLLEDQFPLYTAAKRIQGVPAREVVYDVARTDKLKRAMLTEERFHRASIPYSDAALQMVWEDNLMAAQALVRAYQTGEIYSVPNPRSCGWACDFYRVHIEGRNSGRDYVEVAKGYGFVEAVDRYPDANRSSLPVQEADDEW